jgi:hypothetical protein
MLQRREQKRAEFAFAPVHRSQEIFGQKPGEEFLRQVLGVRRLVAASANERIKRPPIGPTQPFEGGV